MKYPHQFDPLFGSAIQYNSEGVASLVYMIRNRDYDRNVDTEKVLYLLAGWDAQDCMDYMSKFYIREPYDIKSHSHQPNTPMYMEALSGEHMD